MCVCVCACACVCVLRKVLLDKVLHHTNALLLLLLLLKFTPVSTKGGPQRRMVLVRGSVTWSHEQNSLWKCLKDPGMHTSVYYMSEL